MTQPIQPFRPLPWHAEAGETNNALPVDDTPDDARYCNKRGPGSYLCTMPQHHDGFHRAGDGEVICAEWAQGQPIQPAEPTQEWVFTFGNGNTLPDGTDAYGHFVAIIGTWDTARAEMVARHGNAWCDQYSSREAAGVDEFGLTQFGETLTAGAAEPPIVAEALNALRHFFVADRAAAASLLAMWRRRGDLTSSDIHAILAHYGDELIDRERVLVEAAEPAIYAEILHRLPTGVEGTDGGEQR